MDPQQRLLLEVTWRALEDAGIPAESLAGSSTGVTSAFRTATTMGSSSSADGDIDVHAATGGALSIAANRMSHRLDLRGPSLAIDTACSSSLVALDVACTALRTGECDATGRGRERHAHARRHHHLQPGFHAVAGRSLQGVRCARERLRPQRRRRHRGAQAPVASARRRRSHLRGDSRHRRQSGRPHQHDHGRRAATRRSRCCARPTRRAGVRPSHVGYVEAHGTGTAVGDPIEASAIGTVFGEATHGGGRLRHRFGQDQHRPPRAGRRHRGVDQGGLCVRQGEIPPSLHFERPNPHIDFDGLGIRVQRRLGAWPSGHRSRIAGVNSFGFGGTNACAVVEQPPQPAEPIFDDASPDWRPTLVPVSAASKTALTTACAQLADRLEARPCAFPDVAGTLALRRSHLDHRLVVAAQSVEVAVSALRAVAATRRPTP